MKCSEVLLGPSPEERHMLKAFTRRESVDGDECCVEEPVELLRLLELVSDDYWFLLPNR